MGEKFEEHNKLPELKLDAKQAQGFLYFFKTLPCNPRAIRFFDRRDYYTAHGENATFIAKTYYHTTTALRQLGSGSDAISSVSVSRNMFETIARDLLLERTDHTLELYEGSGSNWRVAKSGSPGNLGSFEDILFANNEMQDSPVIVALAPNFCENGCTVGLGYVDLTRRVLGLAEFLDDSHFTNLESALVALGCKECLLPADTAKSCESRPLHDAMLRCGVMVTERKKTEFKGRDLVQDLGRIVKDSLESVHDLVSGFEVAPGALAAIISYAELLSDESNYGSYTIGQYNLDNYMRLDSAALRALNVMESKSDANKNFSLFGLLNRTCTAGMGKRLLHMWLKQPLLDVNEINARLDLVQAFVEDAALRQDLRQHLKRISDIERLMRFLEKKRANLAHVVKLYQSSIRLPYIKSALERYDGQFASLIKERYLDSLEDLTDDDHLNKFIALVEVSVDLDQLENGEYMISSGYNPALAALKEKQETLDQQIHNLHKQTANDLDLAADKTLKLDKGTQFGHVFRITKKEEPKVRKKLNTHFIILETRKDGVKFTNSKLKKLALLLVSEGLAALAFTGVEVNMVLFSKSVLRQSNAEAANNFSRWMGTLNLCTLLGAILSDSFFGRFFTALVFQALLVIALIMLSLSTQEILLEPKDCGKIGKTCNPQSPIGISIFYVSIYLLALGSGSIEPALATLGAEQFDEDDPKENQSKTKFFSYFYVALNLGSLIAETLLVYLENLGKWVLAFWVSTCCGLVALIFLLSGTFRYRHFRPSGNPIARFFQVIVASIRKIKIQVPPNGDLLYEGQGMLVKDNTRRIFHTHDFRFLDKAAVITPSDMIILPDKTQTSNPWSLCTVTQVEEVKCVLRLLPIWFCTILGSLVFVQVLSLFVEQGAAMNTSISSFHIPPASMTAFDIISTSTFIICYEHLIVPLYVKITKRKPKLPNELQRIGIGLVISIIGMTIAGLVEQHRLRYSNGGINESSSLSIFWQTPQYVLVGIAEAFIYVAQWEFFTSEIPEGLKSIGLGLSMSSSALGSYFCSILLTVVMKITSKHGKPGWISANLNDGHMDRFFFLSAALTAFDLMLFIMCAKWYKRVEREKRNGRIDQVGGSVP